MNRLSAFGLAAAAAAIAAPAAAVVEIPTMTFAAFAQNPVRGATPKLALYRNEDTVKTTGVTVKTPHSVTTLVTTTALVNVTTYKTTYVTKIDPVTHKAVTTKVVTPVVTPTLVTTTKPVTTTTYTSVTTYSTKVTPKAELYTTIGSGSTPASPQIKFNYLTDFNAYLEPLIGGRQQAFLTLYALSTSVAIVDGTSISQVFESGSISFRRTVPVMTLGAHPKPLSNLLTAVFTEAMLNGSVGSSVFTLNASTPGSVVTYTSDFLNFEHNVSSGISLTFNAVTPQMAIAITTPTAFNQTNVTGAHTLVTTRATLAGQFSASSVPEPAVWTLMLSGFALVGFRVRRRPARRAM